MKRNRRNLARELFVFSIKLGLRAIRHGKISKEIIKRIVCPMDPSRCYELPEVVNSINLKEGNRVLDLSSPKLITFYLAYKNPQVTFYAVDNFQTELNAWKVFAGSYKNLIIEKQDATNLKYPNNFFDKVYSVSVIEHVGDDRKLGDERMVKEVYRVLKRKGIFIFTTMLSNKYAVVYKARSLYSNDATGNKHFFCRIYNYGTLKKRVLKATKFKKVKEKICNYRFVAYERIFNKFVPFSVFFGWFNFFVYPLLISTTDNVNDLSNRADYFAVLEK